MSHKQEISVARARELIDGGYSYREAGRVLAQELGRPVPFHGSSVANALSVADGKRPSYADRCRLQCQPQEITP